MNVALDLKPGLSGLGVYMFIKLSWLISSSSSIYLQINHRRTQIKESDYGNFYRKEMINTSEMGKLRYSIVIVLLSFFCF